MLVTSTETAIVSSGLKYRVFAAFGLQETGVFYAASQRMKTISTKGFRFEWFSGDPFTLAQLSEEGGLGIHKTGVSVAAQVRGLFKSIVTLYPSDNSNFRSTCMSSSFFGDLQSLLFPTNEAAFSLST